MGTSNIVIFVVLVVIAIVFGTIARLQHVRRKRQQEREAGRRAIYGPPLESYRPAVPLPLDTLVAQAV